MRSSKSRSRSKSNRPRTIGNIINRVFDSSGPEGKVRGTPQQIIDKYLILARDAQLSNDRVAAENFQQHAEHYTRMLGEAMREMAAEQDQRRDGNPNGNQNGNQNGNAYGQNGGYRDRPGRDDQPESPSGQRTVHVIDLADDGDDSNLVETPEARSRIETPRTDYVERAPQPERTERPDRGDRNDRRNDRPRFPQGERREDRRPAPQADPGPQAEPVTVPLSPMMPSFVTLPEDAAGDAKPAAARRPRAPRKPKAPGGSSEGGPAEAAE